jgi:hypothetical protein
MHISMRYYSDTDKQLSRYDVDSETHPFTIDALKKIRDAGCELFVYHCVGVLESQYSSP